jgi:hypothetical protein
MVFRQPTRLWLVWTIAYERGSPNPPWPAVPSIWLVYFRLGPRPEPEPVCLVRLRTLVLINLEGVKKMKQVVLSIILCGILALPAQAAWCVWPADPYAAPHPCRFGGVPVAPSAGYWWGDTWIYGPWHPWGVAPAFRFVPHWERHDWRRERDWR